MLIKSLTAAAVGLLAVAPAFAEPPKVDTGLPEYRVVSGVSGTIGIKGSDTMHTVSTLWTGGFKTLYPNIVPELEAKGSGSAPTALIEGTANFGAMSREMKPDEVDKFNAKFGYKPTALPTSIDLLAVFVHKDNPLAKLTLPQVDAVFSKARKGGAEKDAVTWGDLGLTGEWANKPISLYGRNSASGTYTYFKEHALYKGDFKDSVKEQPGTSAVVQAVASDKYAIGYGGIGAATADVRAVPLAKDAKTAAIEPTAENAYTSKYPLSRFLFLYVNYAPGSTLDPLRAEFIRYVFSKQGQDAVIRAESFPVPAKIALKALESVGLAPKQ